MERRIFESGNIAVVISAERSGAKIRLDLSEEGDNSVWIDAKDLGAVLKVLGAAFDYLAQSQRVKLLEIIESCMKEPASRKED